MKQYNKIEAIDDRDALKRVVEQSQKLCVKCNEPAVKGYLCSDCFEELNKGQNYEYK